MVRFFAHWFLVAVALGVASWILAGVEFDSIWAWLVGGLVLGLLNAVVRPVFTLVTLPLTVLTLGLFYLVINGLVFGLAAWIVPGFEVAGIGAAIGGALLVSLISWIMGGLGIRREGVTPRP